MAADLPLSRLFSDPALTGTPPHNVQFSPDGEFVTFLQGSDDDSERYNLWLMSVTQGQPQEVIDTTKLALSEPLSDEEKARRERQRIFGEGILAYQWSPQGNAFLFELGGDIYLYHISQQRLEHFTDAPQFDTDARFSPQGTYVSFIRSQNLYVKPVAGGEPLAITTKGGGTIKYGMAEFAAQEEMDRMTGYWWADDEQHIALTRIDESPVPEATRNEIYASGIKEVKQRYPYAGDNNVTIDLGIAPIKANADIHWLDIKGEHPDGYLARVAWAPDSQRLSYQWQSRNQQDLTLGAYDLKRQEYLTLLAEHSETWLNILGNPHFLKSGKGYLWLSERTGYKHIYYSTWNGYTVRQLTSGPWQVDDVVDVDEKQGWVYFTGRKSDPLQSQLYRVALDGHSEPQQITKQPGIHHIEFAANHHYYIDTYSNDHQPPQIGIYDVSGQRQQWIYENALTAGHPLFPYLGKWSTPQYGTLKAEDGQPLYYRLWQPTHLVPGKQYPVITLIYGGPGVQTVTKGWSRQTLLAQYLVQHGYLVFQLDNRGSTGRGKQFEEVIYRHLASHELADQHQGVTFLRSLPYVDPKRIGIYGHSYGGYMTLMAMFRAGNDYAAGVAGAPVTDWALYDTHYTERYLGTPQNNAQGYQQSSVFPYTKGLSGSLLIYHGMADDNVLFTHTTRVVDALQKQGSLFELMTYPGAKHSLFGQTTRLHQYRTIVDFFDRKLKTAH